MNRIIQIIMICLISGRALGADEALTLAQQCEKDLLSFPGPKTEKIVREACAKVTAKDICKSVEGKTIYQYDKNSMAKNGGKNVLVFSLIHGDETPAGSIGRYWMERLETIDPRNNWRVIPVLNPDGVQRKTRTNANKIDLNRNFPTKDWTEHAVSLWKSKTNSNPRRFPGTEGGSEPEVRCALSQIEDFKPDFIVSVHTPLKVLDFDGPSLKKKNLPRIDDLPWASLGTFPGSLGRYMWFERKTPVLTIELHEDSPKDYRPFESLQDLIGVMAVLEKPAVAESDSARSPGSL